MKRFGVRRRTRYGGLALVVGVAAIVVAIVTATAQATPNKPYTANVHRTFNTPGSFTFTLTNDAHASQSLGSANFTPPSGVTLTPGTVGTNVNHAGWTATVNASGILEFRSTTGNALGAGGTVSADVTFAINATNCTATPGTATWTVEAKQSNDFSGQPGNDLTLGVSDLTPLGSFVFAPVETVVTLPDSSKVHVPQIVTGAAAPLNLTALDTCGNVDSDYSGGTLAAVSGLAGATFAGPLWSGGSTNPNPNAPTTTVTPKAVEVGDQIKITDSTTGITANSTSTPPQSTFDVVETICAIPGQTCSWADTHTPGINATSTLPIDHNGQALGLGFKQFVPADACSSKPGLGDSIQIDPYQYGDGTAFWVYVVYPKSIVPSGPASRFIGCKWNEGTQTWDPMTACPKVPTPPCFTSSNLPGGKLQIAFYLDPTDPRTGGFG